MSIQELYRASVPIAPSSTNAERVAPKGNEFKELLKKETVNFSQHAQTRINSREIPWNHELEKRVSQGLDAAEKKGSREALILADDVAVIANVKSRTVITAMDRSQMKEKIFTNIDSAVLV